MLLRTDDIFATIEAMPLFRDASTVLAYWSVRDEVPTHEFLEKWQGSKRMLVPRVCGERLDLCVYDPSQMQRGAFGIMEPAPEAVAVLPEEVDFAIIPGEAFDADGNRKGHGKGYYDRLLPHLKCLKVGIAPSHKIVERLIPQPWDAPVDVVITGI